MSGDDFVGFGIFLFLGVYLTIFNKSIVSEMTKYNSKLFPMRKPSEALVRFYQVIGYVLGTAFIVAAISFVVF